MPIDPDAYGYDILSTFDLGYRARRIHDLLSNNDDLTIEDMMVYQADSLEVFAHSIVPFVVDAWDYSGVDNSEIQSVVDELRNWDYVMDTDEAMPTFWCYLSYSIRDLTFDEVDDIFFTPWDTALEDFIVNNKPYYFARAHCGTCVDKCHFGSRKMVNGKLEVNLDRCFGCGLCVSTCPTNAIMLTENTLNR
jgi:acyl-homoserine lactone acylase PvdQ